MFDCLSLPSTDRITYIPGDFPVNVSETGIVQSDFHLGTKSESEALISGIS